MTDTIRSRVKWKVSVVVIRCLLGLFLPSGLKAFCDTAQARIGKNNCIQVARYRAPQWATCVTDSYIRQKSKGKHGCLEHKANCLYQCMLEAHGLDSGDVSLPCRCSVTEPTTEGAYSRPTKLPSWCFSPTGAECNWYRNCLNPRYLQCDKRFTTEIIAFAEQFCQLFLNAYSQFTSLGDLWLNGVRKCFLVSLVPRLRNWHQVEDCEDLTTNAITSFSDCFMAPFPGIPSICRVPLADLWTMFWHMRQTLPAFSRRGLEGMLRSIENCTRFQREDLLRGRVRKLTFQFNARAPSTKRDLSGGLEFDEEHGDRFELAKAFGDEIAKKFRCNEKGIVWFAYNYYYYSINAEQQSGRKLAFFFADSYEHKLSQKMPNSRPVVDLNHTVSKLVTAFRGKTLLLQTFDSRQQYEITGITVCRDFACRHADTWNTSLVSLPLCSSSGQRYPLLYSYPLALLIIYVILSH